MITVVLVIHLLIAAALIGVVMLQRSEGGALGIGGGGAGSLFSSRGAANALTRATAILAIGFFLTSITLTMLARHQAGGGTIFDSMAPAAPASGDAPATGSDVLPQLPAAPAAPAQPQVPSSN